MSSSLTERAISLPTMWHVYFLKNEEGANYVGCTGRDPAVRLDEHNAGLNRWTKARRPWRLVHSESFVTKSDALKREKFFKTGAGRRLRDEILDGLRE